MIGRRGLLYTHLLKFPKTVCAKWVRRGVECSRQDINPFYLLRHCFRTNCNGHYLFIIVFFFQSLSKKILKKVLRISTTIIVIYTAVNVYQEQLYDIIHNTTNRLAGTDHTTIVGCVYYIIYFVVLLIPIYLGIYISSSKVN